MTEENLCESCSGTSCGQSSEQKSPKEQEEIEQRSVEGSIDRREFARSLGRIKHKVIVMSCKGGVGKSTVAVNMAMALSLAGREVGLMDTDLHGPSVPRMLNMEDGVVKTAGQIILPEQYEKYFKVMSLGFMLRSKDDAVIWRGPSKISFLQQFLREVQWGDLDFLIIDSPPGTGDEPLTICQLIPNIDGAVIVTTPQGISITDVRKTITFCRKIHIPIIGVIENMSGLVCPHCKKEIEIFGVGGGREMCEDLDVPYLGSIPLDPIVAKSAETGKPFVYEHISSETTFAFQRILPVIMKIQDDAKEIPRSENPLQ